MVIIMRTYLSLYGSNARNIWNYTLSSQFSIIIGERGYYQ